YNDFVSWPRSRRALVRLLPSSQRGMALQRTIQLRLVRSVFRRLSPLAALGGQARVRSSEQGARSSEMDRDFDRRCGDNHPAAAHVGSCQFGLSEARLVARVCRRNYYLIDHLSVRCWLVAPAF